MNQTSSSSQQQHQNVLLGYWNYPGRAQHIRLALEYLNVKYLEKTYDTNIPDQWYETDKKELGMDFPNLPYLQCGDIFISENQNIIDFVAQKFGPELLGNGDDKFKVNEIRLVLDDIGGQGYGSSLKNENQKKIDFETKFLPKLLNVIKFRNKQNSDTFLMGYITIADFSLFQRLSDFRVWFPQQFDEYLSNHFQKFFQNFENLPRIKEFMNSKRYIKY